MHEDIPWTWVLLGWEQNEFFRRSKIELQIPCIALIGSALSFFLVADSVSQEFSRRLKVSNWRVNSGNLGTGNSIPHPKGIYWLKVNKGTLFP